MKNIEDGNVSNDKNTIKVRTNKERVISGIKRISKPGIKSLCWQRWSPKVLNGLGIAIISTSKGILTDKKLEKKMLVEK